MRSHFWQYLINNEGVPVGDASIKVYEAGTSTPVYVYLQENGGSPTNSTPQTTTDSDTGLFEFWIADESDTYGYSTTQKFKIEWSKTGMNTGSINNVDIHQVRYGVDTSSTDTTKDKLVSNYLAKGWQEAKEYIDDFVMPIEDLAEVDETDTDTDKNKVVSNNLAKGWEDHKDMTASAGAHGLAKVDETDIDTDTDKNKLVSNNLAKGWEDHKDKTYIDDPHDIEEVDETSSNPTRNKLVSNNLARGWEAHKNYDLSDRPHGLREVDETDDTDTDKNRIVSNYLAYGWEDHKDMNVSAGAHSIEEVNVYDTDATNNKVISNLLANLFYTTALSAAEVVNVNIPSGSEYWTPSDGEYIVDVDHDLSNIYPVIQCYNSDTNRQTNDPTIETLNDSTVRIFMPNNNVNLSVVIVG